MSNIKKAFKITAGKGFHMQFENGCGISVQWGPGNYGDHCDAPIEMAQYAECGRLGADRVETMVWDATGEPPRTGDGDTVSPYQYADEVLRSMNWAAAGCPEGQWKDPQTLLRENKNMLQDNKALRDEVSALRISVARIAQTVGVDTLALPVKDKGYAELHRLAKDNDAGWNYLAGMVREKLEQEQGDWQ